MAQNISTFLLTAPLAASRLATNMAKVKDEVLAL
jgi:hypothetical protein